MTNAQKRAATNYAEKNGVSFEHALSTLGIVTQDNETVTVKIKSKDGVIDDDSLHFMFNRGRELVSKHGEINIPTGYTKGYALNFSPVIDDKAVPLLFLYGTLSGNRETLSFIDFSVPTDKGLVWTIYRMGQLFEAVGDADRIVEAMDLLEFFNRTIRDCPSVKIEPLN